MGSLLFAIALLLQGGDSDCKVMLECPARFASTESICTRTCDELREEYDRAEKALGKIEARLLINPRVAMSRPGRPVRVFAMLIIDNPGPEFYCPKVTFQWGEGDDSIRSTRESDCEPYEKLDDKEKSRFSVAASMAFGPGEYDIVVTVTQGVNVMRLTGRVKIV